MINNRHIFTKRCSRMIQPDDCDSHIGKLNIHLKNHDKIVKLDNEIANVKLQLNEYSNELLAEIDKELLLDRQHIKCLKTELNALYTKRNAMADLVHMHPHAPIPESRVHDILNRIDELENEIRREQDILNHVQTRYMQVYHDCINKCEYIDQLNDLITQYDDCWKQIKRNDNKYSRYIECIYRIDVLEDADWFTEFMEEVDQITEEDDQYLKSICDDYKGSAYYIKRAAHVLTWHEADKQLYESSLADEVILDPRAANLDPWSMRAQRMCYESYVRNVVAKSDGSIFGRKM